MDRPTFRIDWASEAMTLAAIEPDLGEVATHAAELALAYNHPANATLMGHTEEMSVPEIVDHYRDMAEDGARAFLLFHDGAFAGDADLRGIHDGTAEFAFMIGAPAAQGKGLGTRFAAMIHAFGFSQLGLHQIFASVVPTNTASRRVFEKLGYVCDDSPAARSYADEPDDITLGIDRATFERVNAAALAHIHITPR
ncbi:MAG: GNAT family N-acetyltransferase [Kofleriaceae bacterium]